jgi:hypothetical protein
LSIPIDLPIAVHELPIGCEIELWTGGKRERVIESADHVRAVIDREASRNHLGEPRKKTRRKAA